MPINAIRPIVRAALPAGAGCRRVFRAAAGAGLASFSGPDGAPGIYSARWAGETKDFMAAMTRLLP